MSCRIASLTEELAAFCDAVRGRTGSGLATAHDGVAAMTAVEGVRRSAEVGGWVDVPSTLPHD